MKISRPIKYYIIYPIIMMIAIFLDYIIAVYISRNIIGYFFHENDFLTFYETSMSAILASIVPLIVLFIQLRSSHNQFAYVQKKNDIIDIVNISLDYLKIYNIDDLKQLLFDWQYNHKSRKDLQKSLLDAKDNADRIWLKLSLSINQNNKVSSNFISTQESNYLILCEIYEDLKILFCYTYSEAIVEISKENSNISLIRSHLMSCLKEKLLVKAIFRNYNVSYGSVKKEVFSYITILKSNLNDTYNIYGKGENEKP